MNELQQFDVKAHELLKYDAKTMQPDFQHRFAALMTFQAQRAHALYDEAMQMLPPADFRTQKPGLMMSSIYRSLLREIERDNFAVMTQRIKLTPLRKMWLAWKVQALGKV
jgi:phytoene synthase